VLALDFTADRVYLKMACRHLWARGLNEPLTAR
jgi:hypothetical protein